MVFFTCNHCGESVKKPSVEKHYSFRCRGAPKNVSCMDCQKDFHGEEYVAHIKCISEAEKYSGKDYVPKESKNSGQKKQDSWMEIIRSILETKEYNLSGSARGAFQKLQSVDNVPRKKAKFINFASNCMRMRKDQVEEIWSVLDRELEKMKAAKGAAAAAVAAPKPKEETPTSAIPQNGVEKSPEKEAKVEAKSIGDEVVTMRVKKSKSKKRRVDKEIQNTIEQDEQMGQLETNGVDKEPSKKKSKKSSSSKDSVAKQAEDNAEQEPTVSTTTPDEFQWAMVMLNTIKKYDNTMKLDKLKRKIQKQYLVKRKWTSFTEKQQMKFDKKFAKYVRKCSLKIENDVVSVE